MNGSSRYSSEGVGGNSSSVCAIPADLGIDSMNEINATILVCILVVTLVGNCLLIAAYVKMKEPLMLLIANMAASDLLTGIFLIPRRIVEGITGSFAYKLQGLGGTIVCKTTSFLSDISLSVSTQCLVIIALERLLAVVYPLRVRIITPRIRRLLIALTWIVSMAFHSPYFVMFELVKQDNVTTCRNKWFLDNYPAFRRYETFLFVTVLLIPLFAISILYPIIFFNLRRDKMAPHRSVKGEKRTRARNKKLVKLATATVLALLLCWTSYIVINFLRRFAPDVLPNCSYSLKVITYISVVLATSYCAVNPFICFIFLRNFRGELDIMCRWKPRRGSQIINSKRSGAGRSRCSTSYTSYQTESGETYALDPLPQSTQNVSTGDRNARGSVTLF